MGAAGEGPSACCWRNWGRQMENGKQEEREIANRNGSGGRTRGNRHGRLGRGIGYGGGVLVWCGGMGEVDVPWSWSQRDARSRVAWVLESWGVVCQTDPWPWGKICYCCAASDGRRLTEWHGERDRRSCGVTECWRCRAAADGRRQRQRQRRERWMQIGIVDCRCQMRTPRVCVTVRR